MIQSDTLTAAQASAMSTLDLLLKVADPADGLPMDCVYTRCAQESAPERSSSGVVTTTTCTAEKGHDGPHVTRAQVYVAEAEGSPYQTHVTRSWAV